MSGVYTSIVVIVKEGKVLSQTLENLQQQKSDYCLYYVGSIPCENKNPFESVIVDENIPRGLNKCLEMIDTPYVLFLHEGDMIDDYFIRQNEKIMKGEVVQGEYHKNMAKHENHPAKYMLHSIQTNVDDFIFVVPKSYCISPLVTKSKKQHTFSSRYIHGIYGIDLRDNYFAMHTSLMGILIKSEAIKKHQFNENITFEYDQDMLMRLFYEYPIYMVNDQNEYHYYDPRENQVLFHVPSHYPDWYHPSIQNYMLPLVEYYKNNHKLQPFIQHFTLYYVLNRLLCNLDNRNKKVIQQDNLQSYLELLEKLLSYVEDDYLLNQNDVSYLTRNPEIRCLLLRLKYPNQKIHYDYVEEMDDDGEVDLVMKYRGNVISSLNKHRFVVNSMNYIDGNVTLDGSLISIFQYDNIQYYAQFENQHVKVEDTDAYSLTKFFGIPTYRRLTYHLSFPLDRNKKIQKLSFYVLANGKKYPMKISFGNHWSKLSKSPRYSYWRFNQYLAHHGDNAILFKKATRLNVLKREIQFQLNLIKIHNKKSFKALGMRWIYWITHPFFKKKKIWLMLDKLYKGGDSCEYLYRYCGKMNDGVTRYYLINKDTKEYRDLKRDGFKPLVNGSLKHKLVFLNADLVLITNSHLFPFNGLKKSTSKYIRGLCNFSSMCLQHGLTVQKCAMAQRRVIDNTTGYFLASKFEYENLMHHAYGYKGFDYLHITGIARYDGLINHDQKQILLSPTWRMYNALAVTTSEGEQRGYNPDFKNSTYFHIYNNLINNERLIDNAKKYGYKIKFLLHPILSSQVNDFTPNPELEVIPSVGDLSYEKILTESSLMVTDYSGVQFDFAYMRKPIVYFHPEELPPHYDDGIFFYDTMGFGEIVTKSEQLVDTLIEYMKNQCVMKDMYRKRADDFFAYDDHNNCERIYKEIMKAQKQIDKDKLR